MRGQVLSDKINFSRGKSKRKELFLENSYNEWCQSVVERERRGRITVQVKELRGLFDRRLFMGERLQCWAGLCLLPSTGIPTTQAIQ